MKKMINFLGIIMLILVRINLYSQSVSLIKTIINPIFPESSTQQNDFYVIGNPEEANVKYVIKGETQIVLLNNRNDLIQSYDISIIDKFDTEIVFDQQQDTYITKYYYSFKAAILSKNGIYLGITKIEGEIDEYGDSIQYLKGKLFIYNLDSDTPDSYISMIKYNNFISNYSIISDSGIIYLLTYKPKFDETIFYTNFLTIYKFDGSIIASDTVNNVSSSALSQNSYYFAVEEDYIVYKKIIVFNYLGERLFESRNITETPTPSYPQIANNGLVEYYYLIDIKKKLF